MAALNFPANPLNGDEFEGYVYDSTLGVWNRKPSTVAYTVSANAPINPNDGDVWFNEQDGSSYIYYIDDDSEQWIEIGGKVGATGAAGQNGTDGINGTDGVDGVDGVGVIVGGTTGQVLAKASATNYDTEWVDVAVGPQPANTIASDNIALDFSDGVELEQRAVTGDVTFTASNYTSGVKKTIYLEGDTVKRNLTFPAAWNFITDKPTAIGADKKNILDLNSFGTSESTTVAIWLGASSFEPIVATGGAESLISIDGVQWKIHSFTSTGSLSVSSVGSIGQADYLVVAGGGGGGGYYAGGGGGAGGLLTSISGELSGGGNLPGPMIQLTEIDYLATVGAGGAGGSPSSEFPGSNGQNSSFAGINAIGGGGGGSGGLSGSNGGSGGGSGGNGQATGNYLGGIGSQGYNGGTGNTDANNYGAGGGGGAGSPGLNGSNAASGAAGVGLISSITGQDVYYSGGGGAGTHTGTNSTRTLGGLGGGGDGGLGGGNNSGFPGLANTGGGGGGGTYQNTTGAVGGTGGSGIIIIRYPLTDPN